MNRNSSSLDNLESTNNQIKTKNHIDLRASGDKCVQKGYIICRSKILEELFT